MCIRDSTKDMMKKFSEYESFQQFFTRQVHPRNIDSDPNLLLSPADAKILSISEIKNDQCLLVKGKYYSIGRLLTGNDQYLLTQEEIQKMKKKGKDSKIYQIILYLSPGDYHRFHAPTNFSVGKRNHIPGFLYPVKEDYVMQNPNVYGENERVIISGESNKGYFAMCMVGALNVGSIKLNFEPNFSTNIEYDTNQSKIKTNDGPQNYQKSKPVTKPQKESKTEEISTQLYKEYINKQELTKGEEIGLFRFGSTIILVFEAENGFEWEVQPGSKIRYGDKLGRYF
eukprot:TRINITY_DN1536_c0_g1_i1.p1 TRINITY_DN1536_c0_g1~~TRINITY_DN1536_c0_g1_i1.p1  ORF type:complete len:284 (-),score=26.19 TRINITY_DN1536_c0_g1_i1:123-974(-)